MGGPSIDPAFHGEILGATVEIRKAPGFVRLPVQGTLVDETLQTFVVRSLDGRRLWRVAKSGLEGTILLDDKQLQLNGDELRMRPEDRTKRLAWRGRRRHP